MARTPKPTALKKLEGNKGKRALNKQEPDPDYLDDLTAPAWLSVKAKEQWNLHAPALRKARLITEVDSPLFALGMQALGNFIEAQQHINALHSDLGDSALIAKSEEGKQPQPSPWLIVQSMSAKQFERIARQFGMSPQARTAISINPQSQLPGFDVPQPKEQAKKSPYFN